MKTTRRTFLQSSALACLANIGSASVASPATNELPVADTGELDGFEIAGRHPLVRSKPGPTFFEGMLLNNGDVGVCVVVRPDALGLHISKSGCWDIRVTEGGQKDLQPFSEILEMWKRASAELNQRGDHDGQSVESAGFFREYAEKVGASYSKPWPRPWWSMHRPFWTLDRDEEERRRWKEIAENLAEYPRAEGPHGEIWLDISTHPRSISTTFRLPLLQSFLGNRSVSIEEEAF